MEFSLVVLKNLRIVSCWWMQQGNVQAHCLGFLYCFNWYLALDAVLQVTGINLEEYGAEMNFLSTIN